MVLSHQSSKLCKNKKDPLSRMGKFEWVGEAWLRPGLLDWHQSFDGNLLAFGSFLHHEAVDVDVASSTRVIDDFFGGQHIIDGFALPSVVHDLGTVCVSVVGVVAPQSRAHRKGSEPNLNSCHFFRNLKLEGDLVVFSWPNGLGVFLLQEPSHEVVFMSSEKIIPWGGPFGKKNNISWFVHARFLLS